MLSPTDVWSVIASPFLPKYLSSPRCAALQGALYLVGDNTKKVYVYDPGANLWQKVSLGLSQPRSPDTAESQPGDGGAWGCYRSERIDEARSPGGDRRAKDRGLLVTMCALSLARGGLFFSGAKPGSA